MNISLLDAQGILSDRQQTYAEDRLFYSLARFSHRVKEATVHFSVDESCEVVKCAINVYVEGTGVISVSRTGISSETVFNLAVDAIEPKVAWRVDWRSWFNSETLATSILSVGQSLNWAWGANSQATVDSYKTFQHSGSSSYIHRSSKSLDRPHFNLNTRPANTLSAER